MPSAAGESAIKGIVLSSKGIPRSTPLGTSVPTTKMLLRMEKPKLIKLVNELLKETQKLAVLARTTERQYIKEKEARESLVKRKMEKYGTKKRKGGASGGGGSTLSVGGGADAHPSSKNLPNAGQERGEGPKKRKRQRNISKNGEILTWQCVECSKTFNHDSSYYRHKRATGHDQQVKPRIFAVKPSFMNGSRRRPKNSRVSVNAAPKIAAATRASSAKAATNTLSL